MRGVPPMDVPQPNVAGPSSTPVVEKEAGGKEPGLATGKTLGDAAPAEGVSDKKDAPAPASSLS